MNPLHARLARALAGRVPTRADDPSLAHAAVAIIVVPSPDSVLLIRRAERVGDPWSGQMALPGGRHDAADPDLLHTAIREAMEEVGVRLGETALVGTLDDVAPRTPHLPPLLVRPFLFALEARPPVACNAEVAEYRWVRLESLLAPGAYHPTPIALRGTIQEFPAFHIGPVPVWGMTERILAPLVGLLRGSELD